MRVRTSALAWERERTREGDGGSRCARCTSNASSTSNAPPRSTCPMLGVSPHQCDHRPSGSRICDSAASSGLGWTPTSRIGFRGAKTAAKSSETVSKTQRSTACKMSLHDERQGPEDTPSMRHSRALPVHPTTPVTAGPTVRACFPAPAFLSTGRAPRPNQQRPSAESAPPLGRISTALRPDQHRPSAGSAPPPRLGQPQSPAGQVGTAQPGSNPRAP